MMSIPTSTPPVPASATKMGLWSDWQKRRRYVVDWPLQLRLTRQFGRFAVSAFVVGCLNVYAASVLLEYVASQPAGLDGLDGIRQAAFFGSIVLLIIANCALFFLASIFYSHRLAGPQVKIVQALRDLQVKNLGVDVTLRRTDFLYEIADGVNQVAREWRDVIGTLRAECDAMRRNAADCDLAALTDSIEAMERCLGAFKTGRPN